MITNLTDLTSRIQNTEREANTLYYSLKSNNINTKAIELDGREQVLEEYPAFEQDYYDYMTKLSLLSRLKAIKSEKNNSMKLPNGMSIQAAIVEISNKKKQLVLLMELLSLNPSKRRITEVNNSYFLSKELAFDKAQMQEEYNRVQREIDDLEFEIGKLNSETFEVEL